MQINKPSLPLLLVIFTSAAFADNHGHGERAIQHLDDDGDGVISIEEFRTPNGRMLKRADMNCDGMITRDEIEQHHTARSAEMEQEQADRFVRRQERMDAHFAEMDSDGDGSITTDEARFAMFSRMDKNNDGYLSADEIKRPRHQPRHEGRHEQQYDHERE